MSEAQTKNLRKGFIGSSKFSSLSESGLVCAHHFQPIPIQNHANHINKVSGEIFLESTYSSFNSFATKQLLQKIGALSSWGGLKPTAFKGEYSGSRDRSQSRMKMSTLAWSLIFIKTTIVLETQIAMKKPVKIG
jgi:hypothetical protein